MKRSLIDAQCLILSSWFKILYAPFLSIQSKKTNIPKINTHFSFLHQESNIGPNLYSLSYLLYHLLSLSRSNNYYGMFVHLPQKNHSLVRRFAKIILEYQALKDVYRFINDHQKCSRLLHCIAFESTVCGKLRLDLLPVLPRKGKVAASGMSPELFCTGWYLRLLQDLNTIVIRYIKSGTQPGWIYSMTLKS